MLNKYLTANAQTNTYLFKQQPPRRLPPSRQTFYQHYIFIFDNLMAFSIEYTTHKSINHNNIIHIVERKKKHWKKLKEKSID